MEQPPYSGRIPSPPLQPLPPTACGGAPRTFGNNHRQVIGLGECSHFRRPSKPLPGDHERSAESPRDQGGPTHGSTVLAPINMEFGKRLKESQAIANKKAFRNAFFVRSSLHLDPGVRFWKAVNDVGGEKNLGHGLLVGRFNQIEG